MQVIDLPLHQLREASWNPNQMDQPMVRHLRESIRRYGLVELLVVRPLDDGAYEVLSGNQRLRVLSEMRMEMVPCVVVHLDDAHARLLAQALNHLRGEDDLGLRAELLRQVLESVSQETVLELLPETADSLRALASLGQETMAEYLAAWEQAQTARLRHLQFQLTAAQLEVVEEALARVLPKAKEIHESPNVRGTALYLLAQASLKRRGV